MMIAFFPEVYEGESAYSAVARFAKYHFPLMGTEDVGRVLTDGAGTRPNLMVMENLGVMADTVGPAVSFEDLLWNHSAYPFMSPFMSRESQDRFILRQKGLADRGWAGSPRPFSRAGLKIEVPRYCPSCAEHDIETVGEPYLRVLHHLPGVRVCPVHGRRLRDYPVSARKALGRYVAIDAGRLDLSPGEPGTDGEFKVAGIAAGFLKLEPFNGLDAAGMSGRLRASLLEKDVLSGSKIDLAAFYADLEAAFTQEDLKGLNIPLFEEARRAPNRWPAKMLSPSGTAAPAWWAAVIAAYFDDLDSFLSVAPRLREGQETDGAWPCINKACEFFQKETIKKGKIASSGYETILRCPECNMVYSVIRDEAGEEFTSVSQYGERWFARMEELSRAGLPEEAVAGELGVTVGQLRRAAAGGDPTPVDTAVEASRGELAGYLKEFPGSQRADARAQLSKAFNVLARYDGEWLDSHFPAGADRRDPQSGRLVKKEWEDEDRLLFDRVKDSIEGLLSDANPKRLTLGKIFGFLGRERVPPNVIRTRPRSYSLACRYKETSEQFQNRLKSGEHHAGPLESCTFDNIDVQ